MTPPSRPERVFVIDDDELALKLTLRQLQHMGYSQVTCFTDARDALAAAAACPVDVLLSDLQMPCMDGVELLRELAQIRYAGRLVLVSGEQGRVLQSVGRLAAAHGLFLAGTLQKPASQQDLQRALLCPARSSGGDRTPSPPVTTDGLRAALLHGELFNLYQPKVSLDTADWWAWSLWSAGLTRCTAWSAPTPSSRSPKRPA